MPRNLCWRPVSAGFARGEAIGARDVRGAHDGVTRVKNVRCSTVVSHRGRQHGNARSAGARRCTQRRT
jgi:hypothetical protein